jgi:hypothetical protein
MASVDAHRDGDVPIIPVDNRAGSERLGTGVAGLEWLSGY